MGRVEVVHGSGPSSGSNHRTILRVVGMQDRAGGAAHDTVGHDQCAPGMLLADQAGQSTAELGSAAYTIPRMRADAWWNAQYPPEDPRRRQCNGMLMPG